MKKDRSHHQAVQARRGEGGAAGSGRSGHHRARGQGLGRQKGHTELYRGAEYVVDFLPKVKIEVVVADENLAAAVEAIRTPRTPAGSAMARFSSRNIEEAIRIRTGESGADAI